MPHGSHVAWELLPQICVVSELILSFKPILIWSKLHTF
jgi:hypothetical protein